MIAGNVEAHAEARALAALFAPDHATPKEPPTFEVFVRWVEASRARLGISRPAPLLSAAGDDEPDDPRELAYWLLRMAIATYSRLLEPLPAVDAALAGRLRILLAGRPGTDDAHCQMPIDAESTLRRALVAVERANRGAGPILALGDDDGVCVALALLGVTDLVAIDIDADLLDFLEATVADVGGSLRTYERDFFADELPDAIERRCSVVLTDPIRSFGPCLAFLDVAERCLANDPRAAILYADHPDWNFELDRVLASIRALGLRCSEVIELLHRYPITETWVRNLDEKARALGVPAAFLGELVSRVAGFTHLHVLVRTTR